MRKRLLMSDAAYIDQAVFWSKEVTRMRSRGPGDTDNAMRSIETAYGIDYWVLWRLRFRRNQIKQISISVYLAIHSAWEAERARQRRKLGEETEATQAVTGPDHPAVVAAKAVLGTSNE